MTIKTRPGNWKHIEWIDLKNNGVAVECAVMKRDDFGNIYYFEVAPLDSIDKERLIRIINNRNSQHFELWDLMSQVTLNNGINALTYFHQLVKIITPSGVIMNPRSGQVGVNIDPSFNEVENANNVPPVTETETVETPKKTTKKKAAAKTAS